MDATMSRWIGVFPRMKEVAVNIHPRVNDQIEASTVRVIGPEGRQLGVVLLARALHLAAEAGLDLVEVAPLARPPVCKLMDFSAFRS
jgi:translation initiation factor IF-3